MERFTLDTLANAMRGMPRDAVIVVKMPDGRLADIECVFATWVRDTRDGIAASPAPNSGRYAIVIEPCETSRSKGGS